MILRVTYLEGGHVIGTMRGNYIYGEEEVTATSHDIRLTFKAEAGTYRIGDAVDVEITRVDEDSIRYHLVPPADEVEELD